MKRGLRVSALSIFVATIISMLTLVAPTSVFAESQYPVEPYWYAEFFDARWPTVMPVYTRHDASINFDWGTGSPNAAVPVDNFSARWTRTVDFIGGAYKFWVTHDDGVLLWIDDTLIINQWHDQPATVLYTDGPVVPNMHYETVTMSPGLHRIRLEYYEHGKNAVVKLGWVPVVPTQSGFVPAPAGTLQTDKIHTVRAGEWLYKIARDYNVSVNVIMQANGLTSARIVPGQKLTIPGAAPQSTTDTTAPTSAACQSTYIVQRGDNLYRISLKFHHTVSALAAQNGISPPYRIKAGQTLCIP